MTEEKMRKLFAMRVGKYRYQKQAAAGPVVELVLNGALVNDPTVAAIDSHDGLEKHIFASALRAVHHDGGLHLGAGVLYGVSQPADDPLE